MLTERRPALTEWRWAQVQGPEPRSVPGVVRQRDGVALSKGRRNEGGNQQQRAGEDRERAETALAE